MNWITEIGHKILKKLGLGPDQPSKTQKAVLDAVEKTTIEPIQVVDQSETDAAAKIYHFLESTSAEFTSVQWKQNELRTRMIQKFPFIKEKKLTEIVEGLYAS